MNINQNETKKIPITSKSLFSKLISSYRNISIKHGAKYSNNYEIKGLGLGQFFTGCLTLWITASGVVFLIENQSPIIAQAKSSSFVSDNLLPDVKFSTTRGNIGAVLGMKEINEPIQKNSLPNPYSDLPETAKLYDKNPELVIALEQKIGDYMKKYRSFEGGNHKYDIPVRSVIFLETSLKYQVPLAYTLSVARLESRFGTDCFSDANITRICKHKNIYSLGLDDEGNNKTYNSWNEGVYGFGAWYKKRITEGYSTCQIWRRYNPNGDYCAKVLNLSKDIEEFFKEVPIY